MRAAIVSLGSKSSLWTAEAMEKYFDEVDMLQLKKLEVHLGKESQIYYDGKPLEKYDCLYLKGSFRYANLLGSIASLMEGEVPYMPFPGSAFTVIHNKLLTHLVLQKHGIPMPNTYISSTIEEAKGLLKKVNYPIVMKFPEGTQGKGVMFAESYSSASSLLDALGALKQPFIVQEYIETGGSDVRALVVGNKVVAAMRRKAEKQEKRANIHAGGVGEKVELTGDIVKIAVDTAKALKADICGVDILESHRGPQVIEANISPGLQGLSKVTTVNIPDAIAKFLAQKTQDELAVRKQFAAKEVMKELSIDNIDQKAGQEIIMSLQFRGDKIILPELVTKMTKFSSQKDYAIKAVKGKLEIKEFNL